MCVCSVFSVDYNDELDLLVSGSADFTVKVWALSAGACLNTLTGHTEWVTKVRPLDFVKAVSDAFCIYSANVYLSCDDDDLPQGDTTEK